MSLTNNKRLLHNFLTLVQIDAETTKERGIASAITQQFQELGLAVYEDQAGEKIGGDAGNLIVKLPGTLAMPALLLSAHMDRVSPGLGIKPMLRDGVIYSDGTTILAADDLAGVAGIIEAVHTLLENKLPHGPVEIVLTVAEEGGLRGAKNLDYSAISAKMGFVLDGGGPVGSIVVEGPAQDRIKATIRGKAAHAGVNPEDGINAIVGAAAGIARMQLGRIDHETTANIGVITGGVATNIIPDTVHLRGEARSLDMAKLQQQSEHMRHALESGAKERGAEAVVEISRMYNAFSLAPAEEVVRLAVRAAESIGLTPDLVSSGGGCDANIFAQHGIPCVNLGMGYMKVHTTEEYISVENLEKVAALTLAIITRV